MATTKRAKSATKRATRGQVTGRGTTQIRPGTPLIGDAMPPSGLGRNRQRVNDRAIDADLSKINSIFASASYGRTRDLIDLYKSSYIRDSRLGAVKRTRVLAMQSRPWIVKPPPGHADDPEAKDIAARVTAIINETQGFSKIIGHLGHGPIEGFAVTEHDWRINARNEWVTQPQWRHSNRFAWNIDTLELCRCEPDRETPPGVPLSTWPGKFLVHSPVAGESDYPWYRGAMRSRVLPSVIKRFGIRWWLKMLERWGQPQVYATIDPELRVGVGEEVDDALRAIGSAWFARFPKGTTVDAINAPVNGDLHRTWVDWQATEDSIALLGQNLTTEVTSGSFAAAAAHQRVRLDILASDLAELAETITDQWIRWLVYYNWPGAPVPFLDFVLAPQADITVAHYQAGLYTADEVRAAMGFDAEPDGKGARYSDATNVPAGTAVIPAPAAGAAPVAAVADTAFNGAQNTSLKDMMLSVGTGEIAPAAAKIMIINAFPSFTAADVSSMVDAQAMHSGSPASPAPTSTTPAAPAATASLAAIPPAELLITPGDIWIDTTDGNRIQVVRQIGTTVYLVDLDAENPAKQFAWQVSHFLEICSPPPSAIPSAPGGAPAAAPLASTPSPPSPTSSRSRSPFATTLSRR